MGLLYSGKDNGPRVQTRFTLRVPLILDHYDTDSEKKNNADNRKDASAENLSSYSIINSLRFCGNTAK